MATDAATSRITAPQPALWHDYHHQQQQQEEEEDSKVDEDEDEYEVEAILDEKGGKFRVKWKGYAESEATWERAALCAGCPHLIESFRQAETLKKLRAAAGVAGRKRATRHGLRAQAALWHCGSGGEFPVHMEDVSSLVCEQIDEARDLCAVALVCKAWLRAARRAAGYRLQLLQLPGRNVRGLTEIPGNRLVSFDAPMSIGRHFWQQPGQCRIWDLSTGMKVSTISTTGPITAIASLPAERLAVAAHFSSGDYGSVSSSSLRIYSLGSGDVQLDIPLEGAPRIHQLLLLPTTGQLAAASDSSEILMTSRLVP